MFKNDKPPRLIRHVCDKCGMVTYLEILKAGMRHRGCGASPKGHLKKEGR